MGVSDEERIPLVRRLTVVGWFVLATSAFAVLATIAIAAGAIAISNLADARTRVVDRVDPASRQATELLDAYLNQETGVRGYALAGQTSFLRPYRGGVGQERVVTVSLTRIVRALKEPALDADLQGALSAGRAWSAGYARPTIAHVRAHGPISSPAAAVGGKDLFDPVRGQVSRLQHALSAERSIDAASLHSAARTLTWTLVAAGLLLVLGGAGILLGLRATVTVPVARLARRTRRVAAGDYDLAVGVNGPRDIASLGVDIDIMRARVVSDLVKAESGRAELADKTLELERSNAELEQFAYVASHDLQEPLRKVASFTQLLQKRYGGQLDERADQYLDFSADAAVRMQQLIVDLLAFSRVGRLSASKATVFDSEIALRQSLVALAAPIEESHAVVEYGPLPVVRGELSLIAAVFQNLIGNAIKFRTAEVAPRVHISARRDGDMWCFTCTDNGIGVDADYADRIFLIFQRLHPKAVYVGTGIGLAMTRKIVEYHGGTIWLDIHASPGSTFHFTLPVPEAKS